MNELKNYEDYETLTDMYLVGESKIRSEFTAARNVSSHQRKLLVLNESIARHASNTYALKHAYHKIAAKIAPERGDESNDESNETTSGPQEKTVSLDKSSVNKSRQLAKQGNNIKIVADEGGQDFEIIAEGKYDRKHLIY